MLRRGALWHGAPKHGKAMEIIKGERMHDALYFHVVDVYVCVEIYKSMHLKCFRIAG